MEKADVRPATETEMELKKIYKENEENLNNQIWQLLDELDGLRGTLENERQQHRTHVGLIKRSSSEKIAEMQEKIDEAERIVTYERGTTKYTYNLYEECKVMRDNYRNDSLNYLSKWNECLELLHKTEDKGTSLS
jgi:hypothetical protein